MRAAFQGLKAGVLAGLILAVSRPLASGWLGLTAGGRPDTTLVLIDRSPSMQQRDTASGDSKLDTGRRQLVRTLGTLGSGRYVLVLKRQGYDFTVAGKITDPNQCLERTEAANGSFYSPCSKIP